MGSGGGRSRRSNSSPSIFSIFKACCSGGVVDYGWEDPGHVRRVYASDEDRGYWVGDPRIDRRATAFIARFHENSG